jgi:hypothetical protein
MKKIALFILAFVTLTSVAAQNDTLPEQNPDNNPRTDLVPEMSDAEFPEIPDMPDIPAVPDIPELPDMSFDTPDKTKITVGKNEIFIIEDNGDTTKLQLGSKGLSIIEGNGGYTVNIIEMDEKERPKKEEVSINKKKKKFNPHYAGFEIGLNNFMDPGYSLHTGDFMDLNTAKSWNYNLNFLEYGIGLGTSYAGLVTGMGFEWSNYIFDANNSIQKENGNIINRPEPYSGITKSKLSMTYLNVPLILEFQIPTGNKRVHISGGITGGVKLASKTKIKYRDGGRQKEVRKDDFSLSPLQVWCNCKNWLQSYQPIRKLLFFTSFW